MHTVFTEVVNAFPSLCAQPSLGGGGDLGMHKTIHLPGNETGTWLQIEIEQLYGHVCHPILRNSVQKIITANNIVLSVQCTVP